MYYTGVTVFLDHGYGLISAYLHMSTRTVKTGEFVKRGQQIGAIGATGRVTGPHLDWRVNWFDQRLDPAYLIPPEK
jgi:murein DD-endopeptidase MepM/ murein hydrolase activator NlpD